MATGAVLATGVTEPVRFTLNSTRRQNGCGLPGGQFVGHGPARVVARHAQLLLQRKAVHLHHRTVNFKRKLVAALLKIFQIGDYVGNVLEET